MTVRPLGNFLFVRADPAVEEKGGVFVANATKVKPMRGTVVAAGPGKVSKEGAMLPMHVKEGDRILFDPYLPREIEIDEKLLVIAESDCYGVITE